MRACVTVFNYRGVPFQELGVCHVYGSSLPSSLSPVARLGVLGRGVRKTTEFFRSPSFYQIKDVAKKAHEYVVTRYDNAGVASVLSDCRVPGSERDPTSGDDTHQHSEDTPEGPGPGRSPGPGR